MTPPRTVTVELPYERDGRVLWWPMTFTRSHRLPSDPDRVVYTAPVQKLITGGEPVFVPRPRLYRTETENLVSVVVMQRDKEIQHRLPRSTR